MAKHVSQKQIVNRAARNHHVPPWLLWGVYGAESSWGTNGSNYFGLIYSSYDGRTVKSTTDLAEDADISATLLSKLKREHGSWAGAISAYSGGEYGVKHLRELSRGGKNSATQLVAWNPLKLSPLYRLFHGESPVPSYPGEELLPFGSGGESLLEKNPTGGITQSIEDINIFFKLASRFLFSPEGWLQIGQVTGGIILIGWGVHHIIKVGTGVNPTRTVTHTAAKAAEIAAVIPK